MYESSLSPEIYQFAEANRLGGPIARYETRPRIIRSVSFGTIQVSQQGLQIGYETVAWQNILAIEMEGDQIIVRLPDWEHWIANSKAATPNVSVFKALIHHISAGEKNLMDVRAHPDLLFSHKRIGSRKRKHFRYKPKGRTSQ